MNIHQIRGYCSRLLESQLLQKSNKKRYPLSSDDTALANSFADFFTSKIDKMGLLKGKYALGLPLLTSKFVLQSFVTLLRLPWRK